MRRSKYKEIQQSCYIFQFKLFAIFSSTFFLSYSLQSTAVIVSASSFYYLQFLVLSSISFVVKSCLFSFSFKFPNPVILDLILKFRSLLGQVRVNTKICFVIFLSLFILPRSYSYFFLPSYLSHPLLFLFLLSSSFTQTYTSTK